MIWGRPIIHFVEDNWEYLNAKFACEICFNSAVIVGGFVRVYPLSDPARQKLEKENVIIDGIVGDSYRRESTWKQVHPQISDSGQLYPTFLLTLFITLFMFAYKFQDTTRLVHQTLFI